ncbi:MAG: gamma-glutamyltransferase, partial [Acidobacteriota bacterium]
ATLRRIAVQGPAEFYGGKTAQLLVAEVSRGSGLITMEDLREYRAVWRPPVEFEYRRYHLISAPPPSSGGLVLALIAGILEEYDLRKMDWHSPEAVHLTAEAMRRAFALRNRDLGDPDFVPIATDLFLSPESVNFQRASISRERATPSADLKSRGAADSGQGSTTHLSVVDPAGNAIALTTTLNSWFGSAVVVAGAGFPLNNEMDDFTTRPGEPNLYGLIHGEANAIEPGKRMLSSLAPTIVMDGDDRPFLVTGAAGGPRIISAVFQVLSNVIDHGMTIDQAVNAPRIHHQHRPDRISFDPGGMTGDLVRTLEARGHRVEAYRMYIGFAPSILRSGDAWSGSGEPRRKGGLALGY